MEGDRKDLLALVEEKAQLGFAVSRHASAPVVAGRIGCQRFVPISSGARLFFHADVVVQLRAAHTF